MGRMLAALALAALSIACGAEDVAAPTAAPGTLATPTPTPRGFGRFDADQAMEHVRALAVEIGKREAGTEGDRKTAAYLVERMGQLGWDATEQSFPLPQGGDSSNVIGSPPGFDASKPYLIVGGHRDSLDGPGANDNATGVAVALAIARATREVPLPLPVRFVAFGAEERQPAPGRPHHVGSINFVKSMTWAERDNLVALVNLDMIGHGDTIICGRLSVGPREGTQRCLEHGGRLGFAVRERVTPDWSDQGSFQKEGMNTAWLWTGELPCCYHNPSDTIDVVRRADVKRSGQLALSILRSYVPGSLPS